jgi:hypothetical protein
MAYLKSDLETYDYNEINYDTGDFNYCYATRGDINHYIKKERKHIFENYPELFV